MLQSSGYVEEASGMCDPEDTIVIAHYWDDLKAEVLDSDLARKARQEEIEVCRMQDVYELVPRSSVPKSRANDWGYAGGDE